MKVLYYSTAYFSSHGGSSHSRAFVKEAQQHSLVSEVIVFPPQQPAIAQAANSSLVRKILRGFPLLQIFFFYRRNTFYIDRLCEVIEKHHPDVILLRLDSNFLQLKYLRRKFPSLIIATEVNASPFDESFSNIAFKRIFRRKEQKYLAFADCNFFVSARLREKIAGNTLSEGRDFVVHNGVDGNIFKPSLNKEALKRKLGIAEGKFVFGYIGTLDIHKRMDVLLLAFHEFIRQQPRAVLVIGGDGPALPALKKKAAQLGLTQNIRFTSWIEHRLIPDYLNAFDVAIHHYSSDYMSPLKIFEYLASGLPVIAPDVSSVREILSDHEQVLLTSGTGDDLAVKMKMLFEDQSLRNSIAEKGRDHILKRFSWTANADFIITRIHSKLAG
jgi:glycosyltransferase involved in cell wall biosynthesis